MRLWRGFFGFAGFYNLLIGLGMVAASGAIAADMGLSPPGAGGYAIQFIGLMIAVFGLGYLLVAHNPIRHRGIVTIGVAGKIAAAALAILHRADLPVSTFYLSLTDLPFAAVFLIFLARAAKA